MIAKYDPIAKIVTGGLKKTPFQQIAFVPHLIPMIEEFLD